MDRQALFSGTEAPPAHLALDLPALERYCLLYTSPSPRD